MRLTHTRPKFALESNVENHHHCSMFALYHKLQKEILTALNAVDRPAIIGERNEFDNKPIRWEPGHEDHSFALFGNEAHLCIMHGGHVEIRNVAGASIDAMKELVAYATACEAALMLLDDTVAVLRNDLYAVIEKFESGPAAGPSLALERLVKAADHG